MATLRRRVKGIGDEDDEPPPPTLLKLRWVGGRRRWGVGGVGRILTAGEGNSGPPQTPLADLPRCASRS